MPFKRFSTIAFKQVKITVQSQHMMMWFAAVHVRVSASVAQKSANTLP
jgi:hypothetical protein